MKKIKTKIKSVSNMKQITKALEVVATVKLQKTKEQTENYREFMTDEYKWNWSKWKKINCCYV